jgi:hypothetical protein
VRDHTFTIPLDQHADECMTFQLKDLSLHGTASEVEFAVLESLKLLIMQQVELEKVACINMKGNMGEALIE